MLTFRAQLGYMKAAVDLVILVENLRLLELHIMHCMDRNICHTQQHVV
jgi:hypothetical protein